MTGIATKFTLFCSLALSFSLMGQQKFSDEMLQNPGLYSKEFESMFELTEIPIYSPVSGEQEVILENGYAQYEFRNANDWPPQSGEIKPLEVTVIFTKYPKHKSFWLTDYHWLLAKRLETLFALDERFNDESVEYKILLQTDCDNEPEAMQLFHGMKLKYEPIVKEQPAVLVEKQDQSIQASGSVNKTAIKKLERFQNEYPEFRDSTVYHALDRNNWQNSTLVIDWTGSMYPFGTQGFRWHIENAGKSGIKQIAMFNDGDRTRDRKKVLGYTGGIYMEKATPVMRPLKLLSKVKRRGDGGDSPENDIEALYTAMSNAPESEQIILIADNNSCIRDFALIRSLSRPVHIILCNADRGINPQYVNLAWKTGGSLHTDSLDIENIASMVFSDSLEIAGVRYTMTFNNLLMPIERQENAYRWCDRYYSLSHRKRKQIIRKQRKNDPKCYFTN